jgi:hypothetical protein
VKRLRGNVYAFEHNTYAENYTHAKADSPGWDRDIHRNRHLMAPYVNADGRAWLMREVVAQKAREHAAGVSPQM